MGRYKLVWAHTFTCLSDKVGSSAGLCCAELASPPPPLPFLLSPFQVSNVAPAQAGTIVVPLLFLDGAPKFLESEAAAAELPQVCTHLPLNLLSVR